MKKKNIQNNNGISISDSIIMSVKQKHPSMQKPFAALIALIGITSVILAFLGMFNFRYNRSTVGLAFLCFSAIHIAAAIKGGKALWTYLVSAVVFLYSAYKKSHKLVMGFKFVYNVIYKQSFDSKINYYKDVKRALEISSVTTLFIFYIWLLAIIISYFTICRPNPVLPLMVTFPILEIGMYNGISVPVFWGILCVAYWLAILAMSTIDVGEYSGGQSGFVRKNNLFFPKRHMKLKVTERCGMFIIASVMAVCVVSYGFLKVTHYKRSDALNQKRRDITQAVNDFSFDNIAESFADLSNAFGLDIDYENHKLGTNDYLRYKNVTDLTVTLGRPEKGAIYLKEDTDAIYGNNKWDDLPDSEYSANIFKDFEEYGIYPQDFNSMFMKYLDPNAADNTIWIKNSATKKRHTYSPYGTVNYGKLSYEHDSVVKPKEKSEGESSYKFVQMNADDIKFFMTGILDDTDYSSSSFIEFRDSSNNYVISGSGDGFRSVYSISEVNNKAWRDAIEKYCTENDLITYDDYFTLESGFTINNRYVSNHGDILMAQLLQSGYKSFVYSNYLDVPDTPEMEEVRKAYADVIGDDKPNSVSETFDILKNIREKMASTSTYSLQPGKTPSTRDFVNYFLLENHKGFCTHYASSGVMLARMAGIPARYATGYILVENDISNGKQNSDGTVTIDVKDNRRHAWAEVYIDGFGWIPYEFTAGYSQTEINTEPTQPTSDTTTTSQSETTTVTTESTTSHTTNTKTSTSARTTITSTTTSAVTTIVKNGGSKHNIHIPKFVKDIFLIIIITGIIVGFILLRRYFILKLRSKHLTTGDNKTRIKYIYSYSEKLLRELKMSSEYGNYKSFAGEVEKYYGDVFFEKGHYDMLTDAALRASYGNTSPTDDEIKQCTDLVSKLSEKIYNKANLWQRIRLSFVSVLR